MELTLQQALQRGVEAHKAGKVQEADRYYTAVLQTVPDHPDANHNMGVLAVGVGKVEAALPFFKTALEVNPNIEQFWLSYIDALIELDQLEDAKAAFDQAKQQGVKEDGLSKIGTKLIRSANLKHKKKQDRKLSQDQLNSLINLYNQRKIQEVFKKTQKLVKQYNDNLILWNLMGASALQLGHLEDAIFAFQKAININPNAAEAHNNMGNAFKTQGKVEEAIKAYQKALAINPNAAQPYNNTGNLLRDQGKLEQAIAAYNKAITLKPDYAEAYINMGNALKEQSKLEDAIEAYKKAITIKPDFAEAYNNMGVSLTNQGKLDDAIKAYNNALSIKPDSEEFLSNMGTALKGVTFNRPDKNLQKTINSILDRKKYVRPKEIAKAAISLLKLEPTLQKHLQSVDDEVLENLLDVISDINEFPLLLKLMSVCPLPDLELEKLLKNLRRSILSNILSLKEASVELLRFQSALALQCFTNEYIYSHSDEEEKIFQSLETNVKNTFKNNEQPDPHIILCLASYKALNQYEWSKSLLLNDNIEDVFIRQVMEPNKEAKLKSALPILTDITNEVSSKVRDQYEENPYPRWVNLGLPLKPMSISNVVDGIKLKLHDNKITETEKLEVLIAGCGTGQHSIGTASRFKDSKVLAIDLSLSSLCYAKRKTEELGIENINYMQADILDLGKLDRQFDIIESGGVLHHMDDPATGWKVLTDSLKPGGLIKIGLYSELARQHIVKIKNEINNEGIGSSKTEMQFLRDMIVRSDKDHHKQVLSWADFYSLSEFKDLLFHVQEHRFTIPLIKDHLGRLGLHFCGFGQTEIVAHFQKTNTDTNDPYDLDKWQAHEQANPNVFAGMYQFWCQKAE